MLCIRSQESPESRATVQQNEHGDTAKAVTTIATIGVIRFGVLNELKEHGLSEKELKASVRRHPALVETRKLLRFHR